MGFSDSALVGKIASLVSGTRQPSAAAAEPPPGQGHPLAVSAAVDASRSGAKDEECPGQKPLPFGGKAADDPPRAVPYGKGAGVHVPPGEAKGPIAVKFASGGKEQEKSPNFITLDALVGEYRAAQAWTVHIALKLGCLTDWWIKDQNERPRDAVLDRASAIRLVRRRLEEGHVDRRSARVDLCVRCYQAARLFSGWDLRHRDTQLPAQRLSFGAIRLFPIFLERDKEAEAWRLVDKTESAARELWLRAVKERLSADAVNEAINIILPDRKPSRKSAAMKLPRLLKIIPELDEVSLRTIAGQVEAALELNRLSRAA